MEKYAGQKSIPAKGRCGARESMALN
jgi:hypothetical protein